MRVWIVIAAFNEAGKIGQVVRDVRRHGYSDIVVVDDGSSDATAARAEAAGASCVRHLVNRGQGAGLQTGIDYALSRGADIMVTYDADGQFLAREIKDMVRPVASGTADIALGSRFLGTAKDIPLLKKLVLKLGVVVVYLLYGIRVTDSQCGFRAISRDAAQRIDILADRMEHAGEILGEISRHKLKYAEVPVTVLYTPYAVRKGQDWTRSVSLGLRMLLRRLM